MKKIQQQMNLLNIETLEQENLPSNQRDDTKIQKLTENVKQLKTKLKNTVT